MPQLQPHPANRAPLRCQCRAEAHWRANSTLALRYELEGELAGELAGLHWPAPAAEPARRDGLWQATCFELFLRHAEGQAYLEANFAPSGDWAAWRLRDYRAGATPIVIAPPRIAVARPGPRQLVLTVELALGAALLASLVPAGAVSDNWQLGLSAVLATQAGELSHWALAHPRTQPDFHDPAGFALALAGPPAGLRSSA